MQSKLMIGKWLNHIDLRPSSRTFGIADREYWAWKTKDFANGSDQAGLFSFLLYCKNSQDFDKAEIERVVKAVMKGSKTIQRADGSFEEAYPYESSFCVTGLVQFYLLAANKIAPEYFDAESLCNLNEIVKNSNKFILATPETHGQISNHLMTSYAAVQLYDEKYNGSNELTPSIVELLNSITPEGWYQEYGGADPGYQTLFNSYLYLLYLLTDRKYGLILQSLKKSVLFTNRFSFSDGTFSGEFSNRGTKLLYPMGFFFDGYNQSFEESWKKAGAENIPLYISDGNFVPVLNCWFAYNYLLKEEFTSEIAGAEAFDLKAAELLVLENSRQKLVLSLKNGAFVFKDNGVDRSVSSLKKGRLYTQLGNAFVISRSEQSISLGLSAAAINDQLNSPLKSSLLRFLALIIFKLPFLKLLLKSILAKVVMGGNSSVKTDCVLNISWANKKIEVELTNAEGWDSCSIGYFKHMASANYNLDLI